MKKVIGRILGCIITVALTIAMVQYTGHVLDPAWTEDGLNTIDAFHELEKDSLDVIVFGSSRAWKGCDTRVMYDKYGLSAYNYGCNWQAMNTTLLFLRDALRTQTPKVVCIEASFVNYLEEDVDLDGQVYYTRQIPFFTGKIDYLKQCFGDDMERYASYLVPLIMFHDNWIQINDENFRFPGSERYIESRGYDESTVVNPYEIPDYTTMKQIEIEEKCIDNLNKIVKECHDRGIDIIFYTCPYAGAYPYYEAMEQYAAANGCDYINLFRHLDELGINAETDFQDEAHLNKYGAEKVADYLGDYIVKNY